MAAQQQHDAHGAAGAHRTVHRQVRHIQNAVGDVHADGHNAPDDALGAGARQCAGQVAQLCENLDHENNSPLIAMLFVPARKSIQIVLL